MGHIDTFVSSVCNSDCDHAVQELYQKNICMYTYVLTPGLADTTTQQISVGLGFFLWLFAFQISSRTLGYRKIRPKQLVKIGHPPLRHSMPRWIRKHDRMVENDQSMIQHIFEWYWYSLSQIDVLVMYIIIILHHKIVRVSVCPKKGSFHFNSSHPPS